MPTDASEEKAAPEVPANVVAGKRRAMARAIGSAITAFAMLVLAVYYVAKFGIAAGIWFHHLVYVALFACLVLFVEWERRHWKEDQADRVERRKRWRGVVRWPGKKKPPSPDASSAPTTAPAVLRRTRPHPARQAVDVWWRQLLVALIIVTVFATALAIVF